MSAGEDFEEKKMNNNLYHKYEMDKDNFGKER